MDFNPYVTSLVEILAKTDAIFVPVRIWRGSFPAVVGQARLSYKINGVAWHGRGDDAAGRKETQRLRSEMAGHGLIKLMTTRKSDKTIGVCLTADGEAVARAATGLDQAKASLAYCDQIYSFRNDLDGWTDHDGRVWVSETTLGGFGYCAMAVTKGAVVLEESLMPALLRGWVSSTSDVNGRVWYGLPAWVKEVPSKCGRFRVPRVLANLPRVQSAAVALYGRGIWEAISSMMSAVPPKTAELALIPVSASPPLRRLTQSGEDNGKATNRQSETAAVPVASR